MSLQLKRLPQILWTAATDLAGHIRTFSQWYYEFQVWWQETVAAIETHEEVQDGLIASLQTTDATLTLAQAELEATQDDLAQTQADLLVAQLALEDTQDELTTTVADLGAAQADIAVLEGAGPYVLQDATLAWTAPTGAASRATFATYASQTISNPPTQAEVQAINDALVIVSERMNALITDLQGNNVLTT